MLWHCSTLLLLYVSWQQHAAGQSTDRENAGNCSESVLG
jgi:hypothetical protein